MSVFTQFSRADVVSMLVLLALVGVLEFIGIFKAHCVTITYIIRSFVPLWARWMVLGWLIYHFGVEK